MKVARKRVNRFTLKNNIGIGYVVYRTSGDQVLYYILRTLGLPTTSKVRGWRPHNRGTKHYHLFQRGIP